jgi:hypothetical protein
MIVPNATGTEISQSHRSLAPAPGVTPPPKDGSSYRFLSDVIIARELVEPAAMKAALQASLAGRCLTEILVDNGELGEDDLARTLAEHHRLDHVDLEVFAIDREAIALIAPDVARRFGAVPIAFLPTSEVVVALHDPNGSTAVLEFAQRTDRVIQPAVASRTQVEALIDALRQHGRLPARQARPAAPKTDVAARRPDARLRSVPAGDIVIPSSGGSAEPAAPALSAAPTRARGSDHLSVEFDGHVDAVRRRAEMAERRRHEADERVRASEELARIAEARAHAAEKRALAAEELIDAAEARADDSSSAAVAANETLARLIRACEVLEREAQALGPETEALRAELASERSRRKRLEARLAHVDPAGEPFASRGAVVEERPTAPAGPVAEDQPRGPAGPVAEDQPPVRQAPLADNQSPAPAAPLAEDQPRGPAGPVAEDQPRGPAGPVAEDQPPVRQATLAAIEPPAPAASLADNQPRGPHATVAEGRPTARQAPLAAIERLAPLPPLDEVEPSPGGDRGATPLARTRQPFTVVGTPGAAIAAAPVAEVADEPADEASVTHTIEIAGDADAPNAPALAPMPSSDASAPSARGTTAKAAGLRRLIKSRRRD